MNRFCFKWGLATFLALGVFQNATAAPHCIWEGLMKAPPADAALGIRLSGGKIVGRTGAPVVAAFDIDETLVRLIPTAEDARRFRKAGRHVISIGTQGVVTHYEVLPGMLEVLKRFEDRGVKVMFYSAGDPARNRALLKALRIPGTQQPLFTHVEGRLVPPSEIRYNIDLLSPRADVLKPLRSLAHEATGGDMRRVRADLHNAFIIDDTARTSQHQIWIPKPEAGGPPFDWRFRGEYIVGVFEEAVDLALSTPGLSLGTALKRVQNVNLLNAAQWTNNRLIRTGRAVLRK